MNLDWHGLARPRQTVVVYMGLLGLAEFCAELIAHGMPRDMPAAVVQQATLPQQRVVTARRSKTCHSGPLRRTCDRRRSSSSATSSGWRDKLSWYERLASRCRLRRPREEAQSLQASRLPTWMQLSSILANRRRVMGQGRVSKARTLAAPGPFRFQAGAFCKRTART